MGNKDLSEKILEDYNDVFADIVNVLLFNGEQRIHPNSLENSIVHSQYKADDSQLHEQERDVSKTWKDNNIELALYGLENQTKLVDMMPLRVIGYDGASYRSQFQRQVKKAVPVITLVLYFGNLRWNKPKSLKELMDIPDGLDEYVNDYKIHVFEIAWLTEEQICKFKSDFRIVANFFVNRRKNKNYIPDDTTEIRHVDEVLKLLSVMTNDKRYEKVIQNSKGVSNMCEVAERLENIGRAEGRAEERMELIKTMLLNGKAPQEISDFCKISIEEIEKVQSKMK